MTIWSVYVLVVGFVVHKGSLEGIRWFLVFAFAVLALTNGYPMFLAQRTLQSIHDKLPAEAREMFKI